MSDCLGRHLLGECFLSCPDLVQSCFPPAFELGSDKTIVGIDLIELPFCQGGGIPLPLELTIRTGTQSGIHLLLSAACSRQCVKLGGAPALSVERTRPPPLHRYVRRGCADM